ncbi:MAG: hypothetical protein FD180_3475 [Planctomycetota bacterium]|nr:MAG: hypothetical protein FD180_3475 [Planctomycetota bacterium]
MRANLIAIKKPGYEAAELTRAIRRDGAGTVRVSAIVRCLLGGVLQVALEGAPDGADWSEVAVWHATAPGCWTLGEASIRFPWLRARVWVANDRKRSGNFSCAAIAELALLECKDLAAEDPPQEIAS